MFTGENIVQLSSQRDLKRPNQVQSFDIGVHSLFYVLRGEHLF